MIAFALAHTAFILVELAAEGLVKFLDNPKHRRSKLLRLTGVGEARYRELDAKLLAIARTMGLSLGEAEIRRTTGTVRQLGNDARSRSQR